MNVDSIIQNTTQLSTQQTQEKPSPLIIEANIIGDRKKDDH